MDKRPGLTTPACPTISNMDEAITLSTESDNSEAWTLVSDGEVTVNYRNNNNNNNNNIIQINCKTTNKTNQEKVLHSHSEEVTGDEEETTASDNEDDEEKDDEDGQLKPLERRQDHDSSVDELSDGISIISESDSGGRLSPHPFLREQLNEIQLKLGAVENELPPLLSFTSPPICGPPICGIDCCDLAIEAKEKNTGIRQRSGRQSSHINAPAAIASISSSPSSDKEQHKIKAIVPVEDDRGNALQRFLPPLANRSLRLLFYVGILLAALGIAGKLRHPEWGDQSNSNRNQPIDELEAKMSEMELQNNLMRAEIDLLSKQVNYLSSVKENGRVRVQPNKPVYQPTPSGSPVPLNDYRERRQVNRGAEMERQGKQFKAWLGNGKSLDPVDITKQDLKRPYRCPNGQFVELAGMCVDNEPFIEPLIEEAAQVIDDLLQKSPLKPLDDFVQKIETVAEENASIYPTPAHIIDQMTTEKSAAIDGQEGIRGRWQKDGVKQKQRENLKNTSSERSNVDNSKERQNMRKQNHHHSHQQQEYHEKKHRNKGDDGYQSREQHYSAKRNQERDPQEYQRKQQHYRSKENSNHNEQQNQQLPNRPKLPKEQEHSFSNKQETSGEHHKMETEHHPHNHRRSSKEGGNEHSTQHHSQHHHHHESGREPIRKEKDSDWQEQRMWQRENARRLSDEERQRDGKNWFIKRGDVREKYRRKSNSASSEKKR